MLTGKATAPATSNANARLPQKSGSSSPASITSGMATITPVSTIVGLTCVCLRSSLVTKGFVDSGTTPVSSAVAPQTLNDAITGELMRRHSTAAVLFHHAVAERLGLGPTDHKCLDLLRERGPMTGSALAAITGLTSGAITGVVARLERSGYVRREPDPSDGRRLILSLVPERMRGLGAVFGPIREDAATLLEGFDDEQIAAIAEFLARSTELIYRHAAMLRAQSRMRPALGTRHGDGHDVDREPDPGDAHG